MNDPRYPDFSSTSPEQQPPETAPAPPMPQQHQAAPPMQAPVPQNTPAPIPPASMPAPSGVPNVRVVSFGLPDQQGAIGELPAHMASADEQRRMAMAAARRRAQSDAASLPSGSEMFGAVHAALMALGEHAKQHEAELLDIMAHVSRQAELLEKVVSALEAIKGFVQTATGSEFKSETPADKT